MGTAELTLDDIKDRLLEAYSSDSWDWDIAQERHLVQLYYSEVELVRMFCSLYPNEECLIPAVILKKAGVIK